MYKKGKGFGRYCIVPYCAGKYGNIIFGRIGNVTVGVLHQKYFNFFLSGMLNKSLVFAVATFKFLEHTSSDDAACYRDIILRLH